MKQDVVGRNRLRAGSLIQPLAPKRPVERPDVPKLPTRQDSHHGNDPLAPGLAKTAPPRRESLLRRGKPQITAKPAVSDALIDRIVAKISADIDALSVAIVRGMTPKKKMPPALWNAIARDPRFIACLDDNLARRTEGRPLAERIGVARAFGQFLRKAGMPNGAPAVAPLAKFARSAIAQINAEPNADLLAKWGQLVRLHYLIAGADVATSEVKAVALADLATQPAAERIAIYNAIQYDGPLGRLKDQLKPQLAEWNRAVAQQTIKGRVEAVPVEGRIDMLLSDLDGASRAKRQVLKVELESTLTDFADTPVGERHDDVLEAWNRLTAACKTAAVDKDGSIRLRMLETNIETLDERPQWMVLSQISRQLHGSYQVQMRVRDRLAALPNPKADMGLFF